MLTVRKKITGLTEQLYFGRQFSQAGGWENSKEKYHFLIQLQLLPSPFRPGTGQ